MNDGHLGAGGLGGGRGSIAQLGSVRSQAVDGAVNVAEKQVKWNNGFW